MFGIILGQKNNQSQIFDEQGNRVPVTDVVVSSCYLVDIRTLADGRSMMMLGIGSIKNITKATKGKLDKAGIETPLRFFREFVIPADVTVIEEEGKKGIQMGETKVMIGQVVAPSFFFQEGNIIDVTGTSKGKGFQGVVKRHGFRGGSRTHGQSDRERAPGSIGAGTTPGRVYKGKRMAGRMGNDRVTVKNLKIMKIDETTVRVAGLVPGAKGGLLEIKLRA